MGIVVISQRKYVGKGSVKEEKPDRLLHVKWAYYGIVIREIVVEKTEYPPILIHIQICNGRPGSVFASFCCVLNPFNTVLSHWLSYAYEPFGIVSQFKHIILELFQLPHTGSMWSLYRGGVQDKVLGPVEMVNVVMDIGSDNVLYMLEVLKGNREHDAGDKQ